MAETHEVEILTGWQDNAYNRWCANQVNRQAYDGVARRKLWSLSEDLCGRLLEPVVRR